ncbi:MAG TPA: GGDEF domain-containing protein, partial [Candidatus Saccharimonadales bacterium]|nr:GGDEF domain-containing protein [Candidatus Saccharimonadales bacterium]
TGAALVASIGYLPSFTQLVLHSSPARLFQIALFNSSEALYMLAAVLFFAGVSRSIVLADMLQALVYVLLGFYLRYSPSTADHFTSDHLFIGQLLGLALFLLATVACLGAASRAELKFLKTLSCFYGLRLACMFVSNQVSYTWLHYTNCSLWDVIGDVLLFGFALYLLYTVPSTDSDAAEKLPRQTGLAVRSLMPSFLALLNLSIGFYLLAISVRLAAISMAVSLVCYVLRTVLLQSQAAREKAALQSRNEHLENLAVRDSLTGIGNRRSMARVYGRLQSLDGGKGLSLLAVDIDHFKRANDSRGHALGDRLLIALARLLENAGSGIPGSHCVRLGGDEFALLLPDVSRPQACALAEQLRLEFSRHAKKAEKAAVSLSIGVASLAAARDLPLEKLVECADEALYSAKVLGRDRVESQRRGSAVQKTALLRQEGIRS